MNRPHMRTDPSFHRRGTARRPLVRSQQLAAYKHIIRKLTVPMAPELEPAPMQHIRLIGLAGAGVELPEIAVDARHAIGVTQIGFRLWIRRLSFREKLLIGLDG